MTHPTDDKGYRLPGHVRPSAYDADVVVEPAARRFAGRIRITLTVDRPTDEIILHAAELEIEAVALSAGGREHSPVQQRLVPASETLVLRFVEPVPAGEAILALSWRGAISAGLRGMYLAAPGLAATQFEAADARRVFPCFDEPSFKARWKLAIEAPSAAAVLSNGKPIAEEDRGATRRVSFAETPPLPTYLVALVVGDVDALPALASRGVPVRTWATPEKLALTGFGQDVAVEVLPRLEDYFGVPYAFGKLDQVGLPEFEAGAMENAGLITYREVALLLDPATASLAQKKRVAEVVTHELSHQWFGNWVTMAWWDDLWLNEAFATWMAFKVVDAWNPGWRVWLEFDQGKASALQLDALRSSPSHPRRGAERGRGGGGLRPHHLREGRGRAPHDRGVPGRGALPGRDPPVHAPPRHGQHRRRRPVGRAGRGLARAGGGAGQCLDPQARLPPGERVAGRPHRAPGAAAVLLRSGRCRRGGRGLLAGAAGAEAGPRRGGARAAGAAARAQRRIRLEEDAEFLCANSGGTGFYRVAMDRTGLADLRAHLPALAPPERIQILSDEWALVRAGVRDIGDFLDLCAAFQGESDHAVLDELVARLWSIEHRLVADRDRPALQRLVGTLFRPQLEATGWDPAAAEPDAVRLRRAAAVRALGLVARDPAVIREATERLDRWMAGDRAGLEPNLHDLAVTLAARAGDRDRFDRFRELFRKETDPAFRRRYLMALGAFEDPALAGQGLELLYAQDGVPLQDTAFYVGALLGNRAAREPAWTRLRQAWDGLYTRIKGAPMLTRRLVEQLGALVERRHLEEAEAFLASHPLEEARQAIAQTLERLRQDVALRERAGESLSRWLRRAG